MWAPFEKRLADSRIALLTSAGFYVRGRQAPFDLEAERERPEWGDPSMRIIPSGLDSGTIGCAHLHINDADLVADPDIALPADLLRTLAAEGVIGAAADQHVAVMGYQDRRLKDWRDSTAPAIVEHLRGQQADGLILAPA